MTPRLCVIFISHSLHWRYIKIALQEYVRNICEVEVSNVPKVEKNRKTFKHKIAKLTFRQGTFLSDSQSTNLSRYRQYFIPEMFTESIFFI